jgi:CRP/FNR family transcriptional regulator, polysaccharide utilization system transcription regulator
MIHNNSRCENCIENEDSIFSILTKEEKDFLSKGHHCTFYKKNEIVFKEGDKPTGLICLSKGKVKIFKEGVGGREQIVRMAKPIGFIGYRALFAEELHIASAVCIEDSVVCVVGKEELYKVLKRNNNFALAIIKTLAKELGFSNNRTVALTQKHIRGRLAESLIFLKDTYGFEDDKTTSNAIRTLSTFANENVIALAGRRIKILNLDRLQKISELG